MAVDSAYPAYASDHDYHLKNFEQCFLRTFLMSFRLRDRT